MVKQELKEELLKVLTAGKTLGIGAAVALVGALVLLNVVVMMLVLGLNELGGWYIPYVGRFLGWIVVLILIAVIFFVAYRLMMRGVREVKITPLEGTREAVREDIEWARQLLTRNGR
jgi:NADH:ubiquinone oxidoreductase subunit 6 (subunit J)